MEEDLTTANLAKELSTAWLQRSAVTIVLDFGAAGMKECLRNSVAWFLDDKKLLALQFASEADWTCWNQTYTDSLRLVVACFVPSHPVLFACYMCVPAPPPSPAPFWEEANEWVSLPATCSKK